MLNITELEDINSKNYLQKSDLVENLRKSQVTHRYEIKKVFQK